MSGQFEGRVAIVTGGNAGIGAAIATRFARNGASVVVAARRMDKSLELVRRIEADGGRALAVEVDVARRADVESMVHETLRRFGRLDIAVNNAGVSGPVMTPVADIDEASWDQVMDINLKGVWLCMKYEIPAMLAAGGGAIVNISSIYGLKPSDVGHAPYCTSKYGMIGLSKTAAIDYGQSGIRVNVVAPGYTHTDLVDATLDAAPDLAAALLNKYSGQKRVGDAIEVAEAVAWLCSGAASFVNGAVLTVDGGDTARLY